MKYENIIDMHTHSVNSFDGSDSCIELCQSALDKGAIGIAITDHLDIDDKKLDVDTYCKKQYEDTLAAKEAFKGKMAVLQGIELGQGIYRRELSDSVLDKFDYDFILGSLHNLDNKEDYYYLEYNEENVKPLLREYFEGVYETACFNRFDSLAHLTYPLRYITGKYNIKVDMSEYYDLIDSIFEKLIYNKKALELNTSTLETYQHDFMPDESLIRRFHDMGGKYVTVGSDCHKKETVCSNIDKGYDLLKRCGFEHYTIFVRREPWLMPIR
jgi:histidinol-phosphatase (PHP family)